ncbi:mRNA decay activator protein ZFP36L2 [Bagarius yarrelli]|uniref:mRNA decay activator protein ZFP36 n=1 Tax=Bagarius yarrelli TaxID=175774 RepID=A0A556VBR1_BAGYA|nr:mRNA decay activator protein ZFP36L2 [Bagarius yarrelli]
MLETSKDDLLLFPSDGSDDPFIPAENLVGGGQSLAEALLPLVGSPSPPVNPWLCSTRYKTELCSRYAESGTCKYAERCLFAHGLHDLHLPSRHPKYKTELCRSFHTEGYCMYGSRCLFVHSPNEQRPVRPRRRNVPCRTFRAFGVCPFGTRCHFLHVEGGSESDCAEKTWQSPSCSSEWKPRGALCRTFSTFGFCLYGTRCRFQHGLPNAVKGLETSQTPWSPQVLGRAISPASDMQSSSPPSSSASLSPQSLLDSPVFPDDSGPVTPPSAEVVANNAFTFSSQHLNDLLLPLAFRLQQLELQASNLNASRLDQPRLP